MLKKVINLHLIPIIIAIILIYIIVFLFPTQRVEKHIFLDGIQQKTRGHYSNLTEGNQAEIDFFSSIKNNKQLTIFGSSEFTDSPYCSYNFLPDSLGIQAMGLGHARHQNFSILCELLATDEYVENSKICIILSLAWFNTEGTNMSSFLEFNRPNILNSIIQNPNIDTEYKNHIGVYINNISDEIGGLTNDMELFQDIFLLNSNFFLHKLEVQLRQYLKKIYSQSLIIHDPKLIFVDSKKWGGDFSSLSKELQNDFVTKITTNNLYVHDQYYTQYLIDKNGEERKGSISDINLINNNELNDFYLLVKYLKSKNANCSFIIQPLNPYYFAELEKYNDLIDTLTEVLDDNEIPYLNMHITDKANYEPGTLKDIMHLGDYGWIKVNSFLENMYHEN